jgi:molecular chaperone GrpE
MPDATPPSVFEGTAHPGSQALSPEQIDAVLGDFRHWLEQLSANPSAQVDVAEPPSLPPDLHTMLAQFVALRHEVNLQTRSSRAQQEQAAELLRQLSDALEALHESQNEAAGQHETTEEEILRPLLKTLVDVYDALALARQEIQRVRDIVLPEMQRLKVHLTEQPLQVAETMLLPPRQSFWQRLFRTRATSPVQPSEVKSPSQPSTAQFTRFASLVEPMLTALLTGYTMSLQRIERALEQFELEPIPAAGQPFDPETMEVLEVVNEPNRTCMEVLDEIRRGYLWRGRVFRFAQVRVARPQME